MTDRELLVLAAKAAGIEIEPHPNGRLFEHLVFIEKGGGNWNPLTDDGDALRLAVKLGLDVEMHGSNSTHPYVCAFDCQRNIAEEVQPEDDDSYAATRRAIVRAAAEIGRAMK